MTGKIRYIKKNFRDEQKVKVRGKRNFQGKKHRTKVNSESIGAVFPVASTYSWYSRKLDLTTHAIPILFSLPVLLFLLFSNAASLLFCFTSLWHPFCVIYFQHSSRLGTSTEFWQGINFLLLIQNNFFAIL